jgi:hypothetical protein
MYLQRICMLAPRTAYISSDFEGVFAASSTLNFKSIGF